MIVAIQWHMDGHDDPHLPSPPHSPPLSSPPPPSPPSSGGPNIPSDATETVLVIFSACCGLSFASQTICVMLCIETMRLASTYMINRASAMTKVPTFIHPPDNNNNNNHNNHDGDDDSDDEYTNLYPSLLFCSFYSYTPHFPSPCLLPSLYPDATTIGMR